ncbi:2382_t:CDS:2, partial [Racocetra fulgida]
TYTYFTPKAPSNGKHEREKEVLKKLPKFLKATSVLGTRIFETESGIDKFDLSSIDISGSVSEMKTSFHDYINVVLAAFVMKYSKELGDPQIDQILNTNNATASLRKVLLLVSEHGHTLFVGVDEYDAPANNRAFTGPIIGLDEGTLKHVEKIEMFFKSSFFAVLKEGCGSICNDRGSVISKYFVTGVTPAFRNGMSPLHETEIVSGDPELHGVCGFTEEEVTTIVRHYLRTDKEETDKIINSMRKLYNGYYFVNTAYDKSDPQPPPLYNPQFVFHYIRTLESTGVVTTPNVYTAVRSTHILKSIADIGEFSADDLVQLVISGFVESDIITEFGYADLLNVGKEKSITWSLLFYMGLLTRGPEEGSLRIPNDIIKTELRLVIDGSKKYGEGRNGFVDIFIPPQVIRSVSKRTPGIILELKYITLEGLWSGETANWTKASDYDILTEFKNLLWKMQ